VLGTGSYMSPEIYSEHEYGFEVDMWAFGVVMFYMLNREFPFSKNHIISEISPHLAEDLTLQY
jgi:serine/threonine protein kinase